MQNDKENRPLIVHDPKTLNDTPRPKKGGRVDRHALVRAGCVIKPKIIKLYKTNTQYKMTKKIGQ